MHVKPHGRCRSARSGGTRHRPRCGALRQWVRAAGLCGLLLLHWTAGAAATPPKVTVEVEEDVYTYQNADNGAGPMWCSGSTCLVREGSAVFATGLETIPNAKPLNNCRWTFWTRNDHGWRLAQADPEGRTREPSPLVLLPGPWPIISVNPTLNPPDRAGGGPARPELLAFSPGNYALPPVPLGPRWEADPKFTEHSYRSLAADRARRELILFQNIGYTHAEWTLMQVVGAQKAASPVQGKLKWPWGAEYEKPQPIRICYPNVALKDHAVHFVGVSDIIEPNPAWRAFKKELTKREWDYDFRRLFYTWAPNILETNFQPWLEIASRERTCGWISPGDLWLDPTGRAHIVWTERALDERLRAKFYPGEKQRHELNYAILDDGRVVSRRTLAAAEEGKSNEVPHLARFHVTPDGRLFVFYYVSGSNAAGQGLSENRLLELKPDGSVAGPVRVPLEHPLGSYFTATVRAGCEPFPWLDLLGQRVGSPLTISYARIRIH